MNYTHNMESALIAITGVLCTILLLKLLNILRSSVPWRLNCWFCNNNFWMKFIDRNSWYCPKCEQYNGFTKDGDYNRPILPASETTKPPKVFQSSPPKNGLCKMCNINQQLKVAQLANFIPMNEKNFDDEIENYRMQLEKAYKLCTACKKVIQMKLHKEKETLLGTKLLETRSPDKNNQKQETHHRYLKVFINNTSKYMAGIILVLVLLEFYRLTEKHENLFSTITNLKLIFIGLLDRVISILKMKTFLTFPSLETYLDNVNGVLYLDVMPKQFNFRIKTLDHVNTMTQKAMGGFVCLIQIIGLVWNVNKLKHTIIIDLLWSVFVVTSIVQNYMTLPPLAVSLLKLTSIGTVLMVYRSMNTKKVKYVIKIPKSLNESMNLSNKSVKSINEDEDMSVVDTDDDVSLCKYGLHNLTDSSNEANSLLNSSLINGRSFTPRSHDSIWTKPKLNSTLCVNSVLSKSPSSVSDTVFVKPTFKKYQNLAKDDSDSDLDESISSLCISSPKKSKKTNNSVFSLRKFTATPNFVVPTPLMRSRPLISPSKLGHSTSWVAGGYWGSEGERQIFSVNGSRSSSQSSGFESQASSMNQRNVFSQPPSREQSECGEPDKASALLDRFQNCNMSSFGGYQSPQNFSSISSPVFPQMQYNSHVHIPQPRFAQHSIPQNVFTQQQYVQASMFKAPISGGSGLIRLPQVNSFPPR